MTTNELKVLSIIWDWGGEASVDIIAREAGISTNYAKLLCQSLGRENCIDFSHSKLCKIKSKGKLAVAGRHSPTALREQGSKKIVIPERSEESRFSSRRREVLIPQKPSKFGLGKDKRGRLILNYG